jgi:hypothetical protein
MVGKDEFLDFLIQKSSMDAGLYEFFDEIQRPGCQPAAFSDPFDLLGVLNDNVAHMANYFYAKMRI